MLESSITGPDLIRDTSEKVGMIRKRLLTAKSRKKSYADIRRRPLEFEAGDHVFLKVMPKRGVIRFEKQGKLSPRYIGPFEVLERVGAIAYRLALPPSLSSVHEVFHVSNLRKYTPDPTHIVDWGELVVDDDGTFEEGPVRIMDSRVEEVLWKDREACKGVVATPLSRGGNMGARGHRACQLSLLVCWERCVFLSLMF